MSDFNFVVDETLDDIRKLLISKGSEYVPEDATGRFHNFVKGAAFNEQLPTEALWGYLTKHLVSLSDMVKVPSNDTPLAKWDEKINDSIAYLLLLKGIVFETSEMTLNKQKDPIKDIPIVVNEVKSTRPEIVIHNRPTNADTYRFKN